jgi:hypothetical protein
MDSGQTTFVHLWDQMEAVLTVLLLKNCLTLLEMNLIARVHAPVAEAYKETS